MMHQLALGSAILQLYRVDEADGESASFAFYFCVQHPELTFLSVLEGVYYPTGPLV